MSGAASLPGAVSLTQNDAAPSVSLAPSGPGQALPPGVPAYPLASDPGQTWDLQDINGVLTWVQFLAPPGQTALGLESGAGALLLESGGSLLMED